MTAMVEVHKAGCTCSYCQWQMHYGLNIPKRWKDWNSWFVIKFGPRHYFRWTNSWLRRFQQRGPQKVEVTVLRKVGAGETARSPTPTGWSDTDWLKHLQEQQHPLAGLHINKGSMDAAADAYEAEYSAAKEKQ